MKKFISLIVFIGTLILGQEPKENQPPAANSTVSGAKATAPPKIKNTETSVPDSILWVPGGWDR